MAISIKTNYGSLDAQRNLNKAQGSLDNSMRKLSSGLRITRAADDSAGLAVSEKLRAQIKGANQGIRNAQDGISLLQIADGGLDEMHNITQRMRELSVQSSTSTYAVDDRRQIDVEFSSLRNEFAAIKSRTNFNGKFMLVSANPSGQDAFIGGNTENTMSAIAGTDKNFRIQVGPKAGETTTLVFTSISSATLGVATSDTASQQISELDGIISAINTERAKIGSYQNRLESTIAVQTNFSVNTSAAESRVRDVDVAAESAEMTKANILAQAGVSILAQANQGPQMALKLLG